MVTILSLAFTLPTGTEQERTTSPFKCTEQAPHCATPQPYFVPVRPTCSRMTHRSGVSASACTSTVLPLILSFAIEAFLSLRNRRLFLLVDGRGLDTQIIAHRPAACLRVFAACSISASD